MRYLKDALIELDALDLIEKKENAPKQFTIHKASRNEKILHGKAIIIGQIAIIDYSFEGEFNTSSITIQDPTIGEVINKEIKNKETINITGLKADSF